MDRLLPLYDELFTDSLVGEGPGVIAVWAYALTTMEYRCRWCPDARYVTELYPRSVAGMIGMSEGEVSDAILRLCAEDSGARHGPLGGGRRLIQLREEYENVGPTLYRVVDGEEITRRAVLGGRREYNRVMKRVQRTRDAARGVE